MHGIVEPRVVAFVIFQQRDEFGERNTVLRIDDGGQAGGNELAFPSREQIDGRTDGGDSSHVEFVDDSADLSVRAHEDSDVTDADVTAWQLW